MFPPTGQLMRRAGLMRIVGSTTSFPRWVTSPTPTTTGVRASTDNRSLAQGHGLL
ncbi:Uncharacterised protein [Mycobacteroides abscessus subsp. abscessus]|nr:Uncharacterised protein [Mycobacteroides abscessus subsp. abscessus]